LRKRIIAGNWKMHTDLLEALDLVEDIVDGLSAEDVETTDVVVAPPAPFILPVSDILDEYDFISVAGQNCHQELSGAYTGELSADMLAAAGADSVILGHSERREYFGETDAVIAKKIQRAHVAELAVIYCCGEKLEERKNGTYKMVIENQVRTALFELTPEAMDNVVIAYEPVWAIGTGETASPEQAQEVHAFIRTLIAGHFGQQIAENTSILYGGSCKPGNARDLFACPDIDGGLIGGASLKASDFIAIVKAMDVKKNN
jgi:triosephosphate isomerase